MIDQTLVEGLAWYFVFLFSVTLHEAGHAWAAMLGGDLTAYEGGQVSIDPLPHIQREPFGMVILPILSVLIAGWPFGFASAPYDPAWARAYPRRAAWMSLAGPAANLLLVLVAALTIRLGMVAGIFDAPASLGFAHIVDATSPGLMQTVALFLGMFFTLNLLLLVLNLIPVPPLDGSGAVPLLLSDETSRRYQDMLMGTPLAWIGILIAWNVFDEVFWPIFTFAIGLLYPGLYSWH
jgi:Zn-dependent protease